MVKVDTEIFDIDSWEIGKSAISKYCAMFTALIETGLDYNDAVDMMKFLIELNAEYALNYKRDYYIHKENLVNINK